MALFLGTDGSGNGNHWAPFSLNTTGAGTSANVVRFTGVGTTTWTAPAGITSVNYLVVAGGGGGYIAGGGAGGMLTGSLSVTPGTAYTVTVGAGGGANANGANSVFASITSTGGGGGGAGGAGNTGGSGGGGGYSNSAGGTGIAGQGNNGGSGNTNSGGGGGGRGAAGSNAPSAHVGGAGGAGLASSITGVSVTYAGGGGGGGTNQGSGGAGGSGGGGNGRNDGTAGNAGTPNTGGGSGGNGSGLASSDIGGSGVVIISYIIGNTATTYDSMVDVPGITAVTSQLDVGGVQRANYPTWNPLDLNANGGTKATLSNGNLTASFTAADYCYVPITFGADDTDPMYCEFYINSIGAFSYGIQFLGYPPGSNGGVGIWRSDAAAGQGITSQTFAAGDLIGITISNGTATCYKNGSLVGTVSSAFFRRYILIVLQGNGASVTANFGQRPFSYIPPAGFKSLNSSNLPNPIIKRPSDHFDIKTYNGNGGSQSIGVNPKQLASIPVNKSLRFRSNVTAYLTRTPTVAGNRTTWTWSGWIKRGSLGTAQWIFDGWQDGSNFTQISFTSGNAINIQNITSGTTNVLKTTTSLYGRTDAWYHIVFSVDTTQGTALNRFRLYVNGVQVTSFSTDTNTLAQNGLTFINSTNPHNIGRYATANYFDGYMADINFVDGQALTPGSFGTFDANNNWLPKPYTGTYGTNGFYLPMTSSGESYTADVLVVAGGGAGDGGGGGAGGYITTTPSFAVGKTYTITVGAGGTGQGGNGGNSRINGVSYDGTAIGGGGGYRVGGSGGGAWEPNSVGGAGTSGQGFAGGNAGGAVGNYGAGGGGGGASQVGVSGSGTTPGTGGNGLASSITGSSVYYGGGGGGGSPDNRYPRTTAGGLGGGGTSYYASADAGTPNTGGGGGSAYPPLGIYANGGSGVVILRIPTANYTGTVTGSPTVTTDGSHKVVKFTSSGSYTA